MVIVIWWERLSIPGRKLRGLLLQGWEWPKPGLVRSVADDIFHQQERDVLYRQVKIHIWALLYKNPLIRPVITCSFAPLLSHHQLEWCNLRHSLLVPLSRLYQHQLTFWLGLLLQSTPGLKAWLNTYVSGIAPVVRMLKIWLIRCGKISTIYLKLVKMNLWWVGVMLLIYNHQLRAKSTPILNSVHMIPGKLRCSHFDLRRNFVDRPHCSSSNSSNWVIQVILTFYSANQSNLVRTAWAGMIIEGHMFAGPKRHAYWPRQT